MTIMTSGTGFRRYRRRQDEKRVLRRGQGRLGKRLRTDGGGVYFGRPADFEKARFREGFALNDLAFTPAVLIRTPSIAAVDAVVRVRQNARISRFFRYGFVRNRGNIEMPFFYHRCGTEAPGL